MKFFWSVVVVVALSCPLVAFAKGGKYDGQFLIPSTNKKEVWYVSPKDHQRVKITIADGWASVSRFAIGISEKDLEQISLALTTPTGRRLNAFEHLPDADADGLPDALEKALGTDVNIADTDGDGYPDADEVRFGYSPVQRGGRSLKTNIKILTKYQRSFVRDDKGYIWYVHPETQKRYWVANAYSALEFGSLFGKTVPTSVLRGIAVRSASSRILEPALAPSANSSPASASASASDTIVPASTPAPTPTPVSTSISESVSTSVSTPPSTPVQTSVSTPASAVASVRDCGEMVYEGAFTGDSLMTGVDRTSPMHCWDEAFSACAPVRATLVEHLTNDTQRTRLEIVGGTAGSCRVKRTYIHAPIASSVVGKSVDGLDYTCSLNNTASFAQAYNTVLPDYACSGAFIDFLATIPSTP